MLTVTQDGEVTELRKVTAQEMIFADYSEYQGRFYSKELEAYYQIRQNEGSLDCTVGNECFHMVQANGDTFDMSDTDIRFTRTDGVISGFTLNHSRVKNIAFVKVTE